MPRYYVIDTTMADGDVLGIIVSVHDTLALALEQLVRTYQPPQTGTPTVWAQDDGVPLEVGAEVGYSELQPLTDDELDALIDTASSAWPKRHRSVGYTPVGERL